jgi:ribosome-binding factor A
MASERQARLGDRIRVILAERLEKGLRDPRLGFVTITDVKVTGDLQHASVFFTVLGDAEERAASAEALKSATGMLRSEVGKQLNVRLTPSLEFIPDAIPENADHISALLQEARERDQAVAGIAASAQYAGDADPYVKPREFDEAEADTEGLERADG